MTDPHVELRQISKVFAGVTALADVSLSIAAGSCHALVGENGAGKSTLGKILAGIHQPDAGEIRLRGQPVRLTSPAVARRHGIAVVHQELAFCPDLSIAENLCLGAWPTRWGTFLRRGVMHARARAMLSAIGVTLDVATPMRQLSTAQEQMVQIAAAVGAQAELIIFDEPTSSLSDAESQRLFAVMRTLGQRGVTMVYVSHRLAEVLTLCQHVTVLRDGRQVQTLPIAAVTSQRLVELMTGRQLEQRQPRHLEQPAGAPRLVVRDLASPGRFAGVNLQVKRGEILGLAGLVGAGRSEVAQALFGLDRNATGHVSVDDQTLPLGNPRAAMHAGVALAPEDRKRQGLILAHSVRENYALASLRQFTRAGLLRRAPERHAAAAACAQLAVRTPSVETAVGALSGGNQQKVVLARWLARAPKVLIVDEPTRGIDVGAKAAVHELLDELARQGAAVLMVSSDLPELLSLCTRLAVMRHGRLVGEVAREQFSESAVLRLMAGVEQANERRG